MVLLLGGGGLETCAVDCDTVEGGLLPLECRCVPTGGATTGVETALVLVDSDAAATIVGYCIAEEEEDSGVCVVLGRVGAKD
jgi:hypothetical protein